MRKIAKYTRVWASLQVALIVQMKHEARNTVGSWKITYIQYLKKCV